MITCVSEVAGAFGGRDRLQASANEPRECADGARGSFAQVGLELGVDVRIRSMNDICRRSIEREMLSPEFCGRAGRDGSETAAWDDGGATAVG